MTMQPDEMMRTWFDEVWCKGHEAAIDRLMAADAVAHGLPNFLTMYQQLGVVPAVMAEP
jgi:hypothetical protein